LLAHILKSLVKSSPDLQLTGSWGQRWTDQIKISRSKVKVTVRPHMVKNALFPAEAYWSMVRRPPVS